MFADSVRDTPHPQVTCGFCTHQSSQNMLHMPEDYCVMGAHLQRVDVVAIRKTASVKAFLLEKNVRFASSEIHATDRQSTSRNLNWADGIVQILVRYCASSSQALIPQLQLWIFIDRCAYNA